MKKLLLILGVLVVIGGIGYLTACPCGPVPGAWLLGDGPDGPVEDWSFVNDRETVPLCQVEIKTWRPHSINLNCFAEDGELYVSCSNCAGKSWSGSALANPAGKLRAAGTVYPVNFERIEQPAELDRIWAARLLKIRREPTPRPNHWWTFHLTSR